MPGKYHYIQLRVRFVRCHRETSGWGSDEMYIGGVAVYHDFRTKLITPVRLGSFDTGWEGNVYKKVVGLSMWGGDQQVIGGHKPFYHNPDNSGIPKYYHAVVVLAESDYGGFKHFLRYVLYPDVLKAAGAAKLRLVSDLEATNRSSWPSVFNRLSLDDTSFNYLKSTLARLFETFGTAGFADDAFVTAHLIQQKVVSYNEFPNGRRDTNNQSYYFWESLNKSAGAKYMLRMDWYKYN